MHTHAITQSHSADLPEMTNRQLMIFAKLMKSKSVRKRPVALVVEDQAFARRLLFDVLSKSCEVHCASSACEAWQDFLSVYPDIIFLEVGLPDVCGHELTRRIKKIAPETFITLVTSKRTLHDVNKARANNVDSYIVKPFNKDQIYKTLEKYHGRQHVSAKRQAS